MSTTMDTPGKEHHARRSAARLYLFASTILGPVACYQGAPGRDGPDSASATEGAGDDQGGSTDAAGRDDGASGTDAEPGDSHGADEPDGQCGRTDPNTRDDRELFACEPEEDLGASRQRLRLVDGQSWGALIKRAFGTLVSQVKSPNPFESTGGDGRYPYRTYTGDHSLSDASFAMVLGSTQELVDRVRTLSNNQDWRDCFTQVDEECVRERLGKIGGDMFRRPLSEAELDRYTNVVLDAQPELGDEQALLLGIESIVASPWSYFITELGDPQTLDAHGRVRLTQHEIADALTYILRGKKPRPEIRAAADRGELATREQVEAMVRAIVDEELAGPGHRFNRFDQFLDEWLEYRGTQDVARDDISVADRKGLVHPTARSIRHKVTQREGFIDALLLDDMVDVSEHGEPTYPPPEEQRAGFLTDRSFLTLFAHQSETDPIRRGKFVRTELLCDAVPELPLGVVTALPGPEAGTMRERLEEHRSDPACAACHTLMDPLGLPLERYDHVGRYRELENGEPVVTSGELIDVLDGGGPVADARELSERLAGSEQVRHCFVRNVFRRFTGRDETYADACVLDELDRAYTESNGDLGALVVALLTSDEFLYRFPAAETCEDAQ